MRRAVARCGSGISVARRAGWQPGARGAALDVLTNDRRYAPTGEDRKNRAASSIGRAMAAISTTRYTELGIRPVINAAATLTRLGGSLMPPSVLDAMRAGAESFVDLPELQRKVGERIAQLTNNEACYVSSGAAAGVAIATAACMTRNDPGLIQKLPHLDEPRPEIIVHRNQRNGYDQAARQTGVRMVEIGDRSEGTTEADLEQAFSDRTVGVLYFAGANFASGALPLEVVVAVARSHNAPVVVDAAAQIPPISNLWHFTRDLGADAAVFSGGKGLRGPQSSGVILGKKTIIEACVPNGPP